MEVAQADSRFHTVYCLHGHGACACSRRSVSKTSWQKFRPAFSHVADFMEHWTSPSLQGQEWSPARCMVHAGRPGDVGSFCCCRLPPLLWILNQSQVRFVARFSSRRRLPACVQSAGRRSWGQSRVVCHFGAI